MVLAGLAGSGKTELLQTLPGTLDIEALASHRGSAFGGIGMPPQPTQAAFEAAIAAVERPVFVEDEGAFIGSLTVPALLRRAIETAPVIELVASFDERVARLNRGYGSLDVRALIRATQHLRRRLGGPVADRAISHFAARRPEAAIAALLPHFDAAYRHHSSGLPRAVLGTVLMG